MKKKLWIVIGVALLLAAGAWYWMAMPGTNANINSAANSNTTASANTSAEFADQCTTLASVTANANGNTIVPVYSYTGVDGKSALELLQVGYTTNVSDAGFVNSIDGIVPGNHQFWLLCVNGKGALVGAKDVMTTSSDRIEWRLGTF